jgi:PhnB protein
MATVNPIPDTYPRVTPHLTVDGAAGAIDFYRSVLGATERMRMPMPDGSVAHAEIEIGNSVIMIGEANLPVETDPSPKKLGGSPVSLFVYVEDVDDVFPRAVEAGAEALSAPADHFYGDRVGTFDDPYGHRWSVATHVEDVPPEELGRRAAEAMGGA